jgi:hypothetical protein
MKPYAAYSHSQARGERLDYKMPISLWSPTMKR